MSNTTELISRLRGCITMTHETALMCEAADALTAQALENEALSERLRVHVAFAREAQDLCLAAQKQVAEQAAQIEALRADAERWRYAIAPGVDQSMNWLDVYEEWDGEGDFTAAIDAAMKAGKAVQPHENQAGD